MTVEEKVWEIVKREGPSSGGGDARIVVAVAAFVLEEKHMAIEAEREACAKITDDLEYSEVFDNLYWQAVADRIGEKIRARGEKR